MYMYTFTNLTRRWENGFELEDVKMGPANGKLAKAGKKVAVRAGPCCVCVCVCTRARALGACNCA